MNNVSNKLIHRAYLYFKIRHEGLDDSYGGRGDLIFHTKPPIEVAIVHGHSPDFRSWCVVINS